MTQLPLPQREVGDDQLVVVTHVESPVLFYCRLVSDREKFLNLNALIHEFVKSNQTVLPVISRNDNLGLILVYSVIRNCWCRAQLLSHNNNKDLKTINAKVRLIDYGSVEIILWKKDFVISSKPAIDSFNDGKGFCFACSLGNIRPWNISSDNKPVTNHEWSSYANFLLEKETKNRDLLLRVSNQSGDLIICDLVPTPAISPSIIEQSIQSLSNCLVNGNVARFVVNRNQSNSIFFDLYNKENRCVV